MTLAEFINKLTNTTLRNLGITESITDRTLNKEYRDEIVSYINSGLLELYNRYQLKVDSIFLEIREGRTRYPLTADHFMTDWHDPDYTHYLWKGIDWIDGEEENSYPDNLVKVLLIREHSGREIPLNDPNTPFSIYTPEYNVLEIPSHFPHGVIAIDYQCKHKEVSEDTDIIYLPDSLYDALAYYVAAHACSNMNSEGSITNANKYSQLYENAIRAFDVLGTIEQKHTPTLAKFYRGGWI